MVTTGYYDIPLQIPNLSLSNKWNVYYASAVMPYCDVCIGNSSKAANMFV